MAIFSETNFYHCLERSLYYDHASYSTLYVDTRVSELAHARQRKRGSAACVHTRTRTQGCPLYLQPMQRRTLPFATRAFL